MKTKTIEPYLLARTNDERFTTQSGIATRIVQTINKEFNGRIGIQRTSGDATSYMEVDVSILSDIRERKKNLYQHHAIVSGGGYFPDDMLRYDHCQVDVLSDAIFMKDGEPSGDFRLPKGTKVCVVQISSDKKPNWHPGRWNSFGWTIELTKTLKVE